MTTIYDVARLAGVSPKTVSRVLNGNGRVRAETRQAVEQAMANLGYIPSQAARLMRARHSGLIGLITGAISQTGDTVRSRGLPDMFLVHGVQNEISRAGKTLMIADTGGQPENASHLMRTFLEHRVDGMIYVADRHQEIRLPEWEHSCPFVLLNCFDKAGTAAVLPDDFQGQYDLVSRLIDAGHRRIAYLSLPQSIAATPLRVAGYRQALLDNGLAFDEALLCAGYPDLNNRSRDLRMALEQILPQQPTVICCGNDEMAVRIYGMLRTRNIRVPEEISVAGYDNHRSLAETLYPPLTTQELPYQAMGEAAAKMLLHWINDETPVSQTMRVRGKTIWRHSVLPLRQTSS